MENSPDFISRFAIQHNLTTRETELLRKLAGHGYSNDQIANLLGISTRTVHKHMVNLLVKTECASSKELLSKLITELISVDK